MYLKLLQIAEIKLRQFFARLTTVYLRRNCKSVCTVGSKTFLFLLMSLTLIIKGSNGFQTVVFLLSHVCIALNIFTKIISLGPLDEYEFMAHKQPTTYFSCRYFSLD
uniref:Uncharacterized protein n=1 Tax=Glossina brevipalpis TaxID=37001 RepID=A0A1A9W9U9_9MUSC